MPTGMSLAPPSPAMPSPTKRGVTAPPVVDEWGIYDPARAGLAAVMERLEAKSATAPAPTSPNKELKTKN